MLDYQIERTEIEQLDDTQPIKVENSLDHVERWRRVFGFICLIGAAGLTIATVLILLIPGHADVRTEIPPLEPASVVVAITPISEQQEMIIPENVLPTLSPLEAQALLSEPLIQMTNPNPIQITRNIYDPFTIIPDRPRSEVIEYTVVNGDTINGIAERFGLQPETIAWSNPRSIIQVLRPGDRVFIIPVDGVYHTAIGNRTIQEIAEQYGADPYTLIDSPYNNLSSLAPDTVPPSGTRIVVAGGTAEQISWNPPVVRIDSGNSGSSTSGGSQISFAAGDPGSCGLVNNPGGGAAWAKPINSYTWMRGFASWHPAVDVAANEGTPVYAANGGRVIFAGWSTWGYGYTVVLAHGPFTTLYAHLGAINVTCGQDVAPGQQIAGSGNSGNSSGPHLHFEIRYQDMPQDPAFTIGF
jgi:murein DD-endopeptidase MepM/ murein hydrolase activator NlpD